MAGKKWTIDELDYLKNNYSKESKEILLENLLGRTWDSIKLKANFLNLVFYTGVHPSVNADLSKLLIDEPESLYWIGFLAADGSFVKKRLKFALAKKDKLQVEKFAKFICSKMGEQKKAYSVAVRDVFNVPLICEKFDFKPRKTYNPPDFRKMKFLNEDCFLSFFIGYIDGDGCIKKQSKRKDAMVSIKVHSSWLGFLKFTIRKVCGIMNLTVPIPKINAKGYAKFDFTNMVGVRFLKKTVLRLKLPVLDRKWSKIDENLISKIEVAKQNAKMVFELSQKGLKNRQIAKILNLSDSAITSIKKRSYYESDR